ncbi:PH domain-containing protein [Frankia sp. AgB1.9]|uniref:PH domain-containing protein n=1 Tax=unclassified Frankia TaxID=2632575 RepID=UPI0019341B48|nr:MULTISPECIES: PH domain-containing protein [unclassified Frankia]MBL7490129.1 PH domain-containing protein [Frankia sp. AgW1.1]MBL7546512.1 PH domain-containing protein [Frankia sp. AgB1.9]MBL7620229.1 PH domain-containing protein [Frankia sp. AgB1.8]
MFWLFFIPPELVATERHIIIRNPLVQTKIPWAAVLRFDSRGRYLEVVTADRPYVSYGTEIANISLLRKRTANDRSAGELDELREAGRGREPAEARVERGLFVPGPRVLIGPAVVLAAGFVLYYT